MTENRPDPNMSDIPDAVAEPKRGFSLQLVWLIPIVAAIIGGSLAVRAYLDKGPTITITFTTGDGLEARKTKIKFKDVEVGLVTEVRISKDLKKVIATAELHKGTKPHLVDDTRFWVVRPRVTGGSVTGLGTLMGGSHIGMDVGKSGQPRLNFEGLETPPAVSMDVPGSRYILHSEDLGSLDIGVPLYYRRIKVGQVLSYDLDPDGKGVTFQVFVAAPYDRYVKTNTRFWDASGIDLSVDANGLKLNTQSVVSIMVGGIEFQTPDGEGAAPSSDPNFAFTLFANRDAAMKQPDRYSRSYVMVFKESVRGLTVGAPVDFRGVVMGEVTAIKMDFDAHTNELNMVVEALTYPERIQSRRVHSAPTDPGTQEKLTDLLVEKGLRAQLKSGNLLTGQLFISLDFFPNAQKTKIDRSASPPVFPTTPSSLTEFQATLGRLTSKLEKLPLEEMITELRQTVQSLNKTLQSTDALVNRLNGEVVPEINSTMAETRKTLDSARQALVAAEQILSADAPLQQDLRESLRELGRAARSLQTLTEYLERHPESLLRGKTGEAKGE